MGWSNGAAWLSNDGGWYKNVAAGGTPFAITQTGQTSTTTNAVTTPSFAGLNIGTADPTRIVVALIGHGPNSGTTISGLTIGGVTATQAPGTAHDSGSGAAVDIWYAAVPSGTTATVAFTVSSAAESRIVVTTYSVVGTGAAFSVGGGANATAASLSAAVSIPAGGGAIAYAYTHSASSGSGTPTNLTLDTNNVVVGTSTSYTGHNTTGSGSTTMGVSWTGSTDSALAIVTFSP
jgi:hypothetical protein